MPPMLPAAETSKDDFAEGKPGRWDKRLWKELEDIASRTRNTKNEKARIDVDLIPDIWARHILFANALFDDKHMLHARTRAEFRGFLALLALRVRKNITLDASELRLDTTKDWPFALAARKLESTRQGLHQLYADATWNEVYLLRGDGKSLLGVTSPLTLICPAQGPAITGLRNLPATWFDGARFRDPSVDGVLNEKDREFLAGWLGQLRKQLANHGLQANTVLWKSGHEKLLSTIGDFETDLNKSTGLQVRLEDGADLRLGKSAYRLLALALSPDIIELDHSHLLLDSPLPPTPILLPFRASDTEVAISPQTDPSKVAVLTGTSVLDIDTVVWGTNPRNLAGRPLPKDAEWLDPKGLFLDKLYLLKGTQQKSGISHARGQREVADQLSDYPVLPFSARLTELLPADVIMLNTSFSVENHGGGSSVVVKLRFPLRGGKTLQVSRSYNADQQASLEQIPVLEVWPPFRRNDWQHYNTFWWASSDATFTAEAFPMSKLKESDKQTESLGGNQVAVTAFTGSPDGFILKVPHPQRRTAAMQEAGLILIKYVDVSEVAPSGTWSAGVDFGTSSTHVVLRPGNEGGEHPLSLAQSGPLRIVVGKDADRLTSLYKYFLPFNPETVEKAETSPFLSFLRMRHREQLSPAAISGAHVLFYSPSHNIQELSAGRLQTNLKWEGDSKSRSRPYLQQICLQAAAESVFGGSQGINWSYSLPAAFSFHKQQDFRREWESISEFVAAKTGLRGTRAPVDMMESFATARYFKEREEAPARDGAIFLDVGGGTTDISVWQDSHERCGVSVRFAGRDMFLAPLFEVRNKLIPEFARIDPEHVTQATVSRLVSDQNPTEFFAHAEAMLRDVGIRLAQKVHDQDRLETVALPLRFAIAGLFYYVGLILRHLENAKDFNRNLGAVYVGGNGSQLLHWADGGKYIKDGSLTRLLRECLFAGAGWTAASAPKNVQIKLSAKPKQEAATGLVVESNLKSEDRDWNDVIPGEPLVLPGGVAKSEIDRVSRLDLRNAQVKSLPQLMAFYDFYLQRAKAIGYPPLNLRKDELFARAKERVSEFLADQKDKEEEDLDATPLFIKGLQMLVIGIAREGEQSLSATSGR